MRGWDRSAVKKSGKKSNVSVPPAKIRSDSSETG